MLRNVLSAAGSRALGTLALLFAPPSTATALPLISEVFYDAVGSDVGVSFVELYGTPGTDLSGFLIEGINGTGGTVTHSIALAGLIPADGLFVLASDLGDGTTLVENADLIRSFDFQNGPDSVVLRSGATVLDALGYGVFAPEEFFAGEGNPAPDAPAGSSLARLFADVDTGDNASDFAVAAPTPGSAAFASVPEPGVGPLVAAGLFALAWHGRVRRS